MSDFNTFLNNIHRVMLANYGLPHCISRKNRIKKIVMEYARYTSCVEHPPIFIDNLVGFLIGRSCHFDLVIEACLFQLPRGDEMKYLKICLDAPDPKVQIQAIYFMYALAEGVPDLRNEVITIFSLKAATRSTAPEVKITLAGVLDDMRVIRRVDDHSLFTAFSTTQLPEHKFLGMRVLLKRERLSSKRRKALIDYAQTCVASALYEFWGDQSNEIITKANRREYLLYSIESLKNEFTKSVRGKSLNLLKQLWPKTKNSITLRTALLDTFLSYGVFAPMEVLGEGLSDESVIIQEHTLAVIEKLGKRGKSAKALVERFEPRTPQQSILRLRVLKSFEA
jgi:hypothetical protein